MSYVSGETIDGGDTVQVWERTEHGRIRKEYTAPHYFYVQDNNGTDQSIFGDTLKRYDFGTRKEMEASRKDCDMSGVMTFESDINPLTRVLSEQYFNVPAPTLHVTFYDIEVDYDPELGFSTIDNPYAPLNSVAIYHQFSNRFVLYAVPPKIEDIPKGGVMPKNLQYFTEEELFDQMHEIAELPEDCKLEVYLCKNEKEILLAIIDEFEDSDLVAGWNSDFFDFPYIIERVKRVLGEGWIRKLDFPEVKKKPRRREVEMFGNINVTYDTFGRITADYLPLFKKYEMAERPSYKLESIADEVVPELPKLEYEGTLHGLYRENFPHFIRYNIRDTEVLKGFEEKLGYVALANEMYHLSTCSFRDVNGTIKLAEQAIVNYCWHDLNLRVPNNEEVMDSGSIQGAFVLVPQVGMHDWVGSVDINSLYPSAIRSVNISPETLIGQFQEKTRAAEEIAKGSFAKITLDFESGESITKSADEWRLILKEAQSAVSGYGTVFTQKKKGIIPAILEEWYATRQKYQKMKGEAKAAGDNAKAAYYDRLQYVYKIKLNSLYGALNNKFFRFFDLRMGESTTGTGRMILMHQCAKACEFLDGQYMEPDLHFAKKGDGSYEPYDNAKHKGMEKHYGYSDKWSVVYGDTDSSYFVSNAESEEEAVLVSDRIGQLISDSFPEYMRNTFLCTDGFDDIILTGREIVASRGIFVRKKRYILRVVDNEGDKCDKLKVMGLDTKKTTIPKQIGNDLNEFVGRLLKGEDWDTIASAIVDYKEELVSAGVQRIGLPKGVQKVEKYTADLKAYGNEIRLPGHVAASILYNKCLKDFDDKESLQIMSGMKIRVYYLKNKIGRFKSIALPVDATTVPDWFNEHFTDKIDRDAQLHRLVDKPLGNIIEAIGKEPPSKQTLFVDDALVF